MAQLTRTWWGRRFIEALESFTDPGRLGRGRSYARGGRIKSHSIQDGQVTATVEGSINPYFGVYKTPYYQTVVQITPIPKEHWAIIIQRLAGKAGTVAKLLMNEMPDNIEQDFAGSRLLPGSTEDFKTSCSCPDYYNPCKHIAGVCYLLAGKLDQDPFLLFELRGLSRERLREELEKTPLGKTLAKALAGQELPIQAVRSYYTRPDKSRLPAVGYERFWSGEKRLPTELEPLASPPALPAVLIRKGGDYPPFWQHEQSFVDLMGEFYERVRKQHKDAL